MPLRQVSSVLTVQRASADDVRRRHNTDGGGCLANSFVLLVISDSSSSMWPLASDFGSALKDSIGYLASSFAGAPN